MRWKERIGQNWLRVKGELQMLECLDSTANMHVSSGDDTFVLAILDPEGVLVRGEKASLDFPCGTQANQPIVAEYEKSEESGAGVAGVVRAIRFE